MIMSLLCNTVGLLVQPNISAKSICDTLFMIATDNETATL